MRSRCFPLKNRTLVHFLEDSERFGRLMFIDAGTFEHFNVLIQKSSTMMSWRHLTIWHEAVGITRSVLKSVQRPGKEINEVVAGPSVLRGKKRAEGGGGYLVRDGVCWFSGKVLEGAKKREAAALAERSPDRVLSELLGGEWQASSVKCLRE